MGEAKDAFVKRAKSMGIDYEPDEFPVVFWDLFGEQGHPIRATISEMGPLLLSRLLDLNDVQEGVLNIAFRVADEQGLLLLDLKDLRAMLGYLADHAAELTTQYGNVSKATIGTIQRQLLVLENQGGAKFFSEPALALKDFIRTDRDGRGYINVLAADKLMESPRLYATFLLWLLSELFEELPEVGDLPKPKLVFFFDEAHLLFTDAPKALLDKIEQVVRLIRSKGVGVYFVTQNPLDVPDKVLAQLGNRVQHALRAFTPRDQKAVKAAAETFRPNPKLDTAQVIMELGKGEALVSFLEGNGTPTMVERCMIRPPSARVGPITPDERKAVMAKSPVKGKYDQTIDSRIRLRGAAEARAADRLTTSPPPAGTPRARRRAAASSAASAMYSEAFSAPAQTRRALLHQAGHHPQRDPHRHQQGRRPDRGRYRQIDRRHDGRLDRPLDRARSARRPAAAKLTINGRPSHSCARHIAGKPTFEPLLQRRDRKRALAGQHQCVAAGCAEAANGYACRFGARYDAIRVRRAHGDHITRLILAEPERMRGERRPSSSAPMPDAIAISASATSSPPSDTSCTAVATPSAINARTKSPLRRSAARSTGGGAPSSRSQMSRR